MGQQHQFVEAIPIAAFVFMNSKVLRQLEAQNPPENSPENGPENGPENREAGDQDFELEERLFAEMPGDQVNPVVAEEGVGQRSWSVSSILG